MCVYVCVDRMLVYSRVSERPCFKGKRHRMTVRNSSCPTLASSHACADIHVHIAPLILFLKVDFVPYLVTAVRKIASIKPPKFEWRDYAKQAALSNAETTLLS